MKSFSVCAVVRDCEGSTDDGQRLLSEWSCEEAQLVKQTSKSLLCKIQTITGCFQKDSSLTLCLTHMSALVVMDLPE